MDLHALHRLAPCAWEIPRQDGMHVPALIYASEALVREMDEKVREQATNVARLPGIERSYALSAVGQYPAFATVSLIQLVPSFSKALQEAASHICRVMGSLVIFTPCTMILFACVTSSTVSIVCVASTVANAVGSA